MEPIHKVTVNDEDVTEEVISWKCNHRINDGASPFEVRLDNKRGRNRNRFTTGNRVRIYAGFAEIHKTPKLLFTGYVDDPEGSLSTSGPFLTLPGRNAGYKLVDGPKIWRNYDGLTVKAIAESLIEEAGFSKGDIVECMLDNPMFFQYKGTNAGEVKVSAGRGASKNRKTSVDTASFEGTAEEFEKNYPNVTRPVDGSADVLKQYIVKDKTPYRALEELLDPYGFTVYVDENEKIHIIGNATGLKHVKYTLKTTNEEYPLLLSCSLKPKLRGIKNVVEIFGGDNDSGVTRLGRAEDTTNIDMVSQLTGLPREKCMYIEKMFTNNPTGQEQDGDQELSAKAFAVLTRLSRLHLSGSFSSEALIYARGGHIIEINEPTAGFEGKFLIEDIDFDFTKNSGFISRGKVSSRLGDVSDRSYKEGYLFVKG